MVGPVFYSKNGPHQNDYPRFLLTTAVYILLITYLTKVFAVFKIPISLKFLILIISSALVMTVLYGNFYAGIERVLVNPMTLLLLIHPIIILKGTFDLDVDLFRRILPQVLILTTMGVLIHSTIMGGVLMIWHKDYNEVGLISIPLFGLAVGAIDDNETHQNEHEYENLKLLYVMMQGECLLGSAVCILSLDITLGVLDGGISTFYSVVFLVLKQVFGGIIFGAIMGKCITYCLLQMFNQSMQVSIFTLAGVYSTYFISQYFLFLSSTIATFTMTIFILNERYRFSKASCELLNHVIPFFYNMIYFLVSYNIINSILIRSQEHFHGILLLQYVVTYMAGLLARFITLTIISPLLKNIGQGMNIKAFIFLFWLAKKGILQMLFFLVVFHNRRANRVVIEYGVHIYIYILLTSLIIGVSEKIVLRLFGLIGTSPEKNAHMDQCIKYIYTKKDNFISAMKLNRSATYTNWDIVEKFTKIDVCYELQEGEDFQETQGRARLFYCEDCRKELVRPVTKKELQRLSMSAKSRCLELHKISIIRQAEQGLISNQSKTHLLNILDKARELKMQTFDVKNMLEVLKAKHWLERIQLILNAFHLEPDSHPPRKLYRRICYYITTNKYYELVLFLYIAIAYFPSLTVSCGTLLFLPFVIHIYLKIQSYSHIYLKEGIKLFFGHYWNILDCFIALSLMVRLILCISGAQKLGNVGSFFNDLIIYTLSSVALLRVLRVLAAIHAFKNEIIHLCDKIIARRVSRGIDMSQGLVNSFDEILHMLPEIIENTEVRAELKQKFTEDKKMIIDYIFEVQKNMYWVAVTVKTKRVIRRALYIMNNTLVEFKNKGLVADYEFAKLMEAHEYCHKFELNLMRVPLKTPEDIFNELPWLYDQTDFSHLFYSYGIPMKWRAHEIICNDGSVVPGIYVIVEGMVLLKYNPANIETLAAVGALPCKDYINDDEFKTPSTLILIPGNTFGEISVMTKRPTHCTAIADIPTKGYFIPLFLISQILSVRDSLEATGLYSSIWKYISINLSNWLLWNTPMYSNMLRHDALFYFRKGFIPNMTQRNFFVATDLIQDIVLVEGIVEDLNSGEILIGPRYLRRSCVHLLLPENNGVTPILFILPLKDEYAEMIMTTIVKSSKIVMKTLERRTTKASPNLQSTGTITSSLKESNLLIKDKSIHLSSSKTSININVTSDDEVSQVTSSNTACYIIENWDNDLKNQKPLDSDEMSLEEIFPDIEWMSDEDLQDNTFSNTQTSKVTSKISKESTDQGENTRRANEKISGAPKQTIKRSK